MWLSAAHFSASHHARLCFSENTRARSMVSFYLLRRSLKLTAYSCICWSWTSEVRSNFSPVFCLEPSAVAHVVAQTMSCEPPQLITLPLLLLVPRWAWQGLSTPCSAGSVEMEVECARMKAARDTKSRSPVTVTLHKKSSWGFSQNGLWRHGRRKADKVFLKVVSAGACYCFSSCLKLVPPHFAEKPSS